MEKEIQDALELVFGSKPKFGYLRSDSDGHWYVIPGEMRQEFRELIDDIESCDYPKCENAEDKFIRIFDKYRLSGGYQSLMVLIPPEFE